jgi:subtilisin-like proprotein convertase family protein
VPIAVSGFNNQLGVNASLLSVDLIITHTWRDDLRVYLTAPGGTERALMLERGGSGENYGNTSNCPTAVLRFQDGGTALTSMGSADNITGVYAPEFAFANYTGNPNGTWQLRICDSAGDDVGALQYVAIGISNQIVGVEERTALNSMRLFPNPVVDQLTVSMATLEAGALQFQVFDGTGREVLTGSRQLHAGDVVFNVDLTALPTGNYNTRFILNNTVSTQRFTKLQ